MLLPTTFFLLQAHMPEEQPERAVIHCLERSGQDLVRVGFLAQSPTGEGCAATFDHITFRPGAPENLRDGS